MSEKTMARTGGHHQRDSEDTVVIPVAEGMRTYDKLYTPNGGEVPPSRPTSTAGVPRAAENDRDEDNDVTEGLMHGINSFWAIVYPVCITMIIASVVVVNYRSASIEASMSTYLVFGQAEEQGGAQSVGLSLVNALVIIGAIALLTFGMALLYKYNCMKFLAGYIMFASTAILSFVGGQLVDSIINDQFGWVVDWPSFLFIMVNFGVVGVVSIFYQKGISKLVQNAYLVMVSVILAWQFSMWPEWTTFIFCFMFAVYDLCAVLTPCGPLKCLINLIQDKQAPLPGLIYEADVRDGVGNDNARSNPRPQPPARSSSSTSASSNQSNNGQQQQQQRRAPPRPFPTTGGRPLNVAESDFETHDCETMEDLVALLQRFYRVFSPDDEWKAEQVAEKFFPSQQRLWLLIFHKYTVCSCSVDVPCPVQAREQQRRQRRQEEDDEDKTIKLGLGDFIFYSVLVGRSAIYDFSTFATTFVCIVMGLGGTLFLLAVLNKALPALPISIFLATFFYLWTRYLFVDFCNFLMAFPAAV